MEIKRFKPPLPEPDVMVIRFDEPSGEWVGTFTFAGRIMNLHLGFFNRADEKIATEIAENIRQFIFHSIPMNTSTVEVIPAGFIDYGTNITPLDSLLKAEMEEITEQEEKWYV